MRCELPAPGTQQGNETPSSAIHKPLGCPTQKDGRSVGRFFLSGEAMNAILLVAVLSGTIPSERDVATWRASMPRMADEEVTRKVAEAQYAYTTDERPKVIQHGGGVHSVFYNLAGADTDPTGNGHEPPWDAPGGLRISNCLQGRHGVRFLWLPPREGGGHWPIVWWTQQSRNRNRTPVVKWVYPKGATFIEPLALVGPDGKTYVWQVRVREKVSHRAQHGDWASQVHAPFASLGDLNEAIAAAGGNPIRVTHQTFRVIDDQSRHGRRVIPNVTRRIEVLPLISQDPEVHAKWVAYLLRSREFEDQQGDVWSPTTAQSFHVVPQRNRTFQVDAVTCKGCHRTAGTPVAQYQEFRDWYGHTPGSDNAFSFHPFDRASISGNGFQRTRWIDPLLEQRGIVAQYNPGEHPQSMYVQSTELVYPYNGETRVVSRKPRGVR